MTKIHRGVVLNVYRHLLGLSVDELAAMLGCSRTVIWQCQCGARKAGWEFWEKFRKATGIYVQDIDDFIERTEARNQKELINKINKTMAAMLKK